ncbi:hypothetical protein TNCV_59451 [Trichonephila clavipes]|nr:hypothetical protein TNCV_59451 [Trichonephila clavipes]
MHNGTVQQPFTKVSPNSNLTIVVLQVEAIFVRKHNVVPFICLCPPLIVPLTAQTHVVSSHGKQFNLFQMASNGTSGHRMLRNRWNLLTPVVSSHGIRSNGRLTDNSICFKWRRMVQADTECCVTDGIC